MFKLDLASSKKLLTQTFILLYEIKGTLCALGYTCSEAQAVHHWLGFEFKTYWLQVAKCVTKANELLTDGIPTKLRIFETLN
jgi:hypothetical protein